MPDFGIRQGLSEFGKAVEGKRFRNPETKRMVKFVSLPLAEQHRIYEEWKRYRQSVAEAPKEGQKVEDVTTLRLGDRLQVLGHNTTFTALVLEPKAGAAVVQVIDPRTNKLTGKPLTLTQDAVEAFEVRKVPGAPESGKKKKKPPPRPEPQKLEIDKKWAPLRLDDVFEEDLVVYRKGDRVEMGRVLGLDKDKGKDKVTGVWVSRIDPNTGKRVPSTQRYFDATRLESADARLVPADKHPQSTTPDWGPLSGWGAPSGQKPKPKPKPLTPEEKAKAEKRKKEQEAEKKRKEEARKKAVERMGETGKRLKDIKGVKEGDVISFHWDGDVVHARVVEARPGAFFTIDVDPETGEFVEPRFDTWRLSDLQRYDAHMVEEEHTPADPRKKNVAKVLESLARLPENPEVYFREDKGAELVDMSKIKPSKVRLKGVMNANDLMLATKDKKGAKRAPISLVDNEDGTYTVRDGNSTYTNARLSEWEQIPAIARTAEGWERIEKEEKERRERAKELARQKPPKLDWSGLAKQYGLLFPTPHGGAPGGKSKPSGKSGKPPKERPASFGDEMVMTVKELKGGDLFGYKAPNGRWHVGRVVYRKGGEVLYEPLHPDTGLQPTPGTVLLHDRDLDKKKAVHLRDYVFPQGKQRGPGKRPKQFRGRVVTKLSEMKEGDWVGYEFGGRWYLGRISEATPGAVALEVYHPHTRERITGRDSEMSAQDLEGTKVFLLDGPKGSKKKKTGAEEARRLLAEVRLAYRPRWQDTPGYKTVVDDDSEKGILPSQTEDTPPDPGQDKSDAAWPVQLPRTREKERALPLPSDHDTLREKRIGPTNFNTPRKVPYRTRSVPGEEYGHPTKFDYNYVTRRHDTLAAELDEDDEMPDEGLEVEGAGPFPTERQKNQVGESKNYSRRYYLRHREPKKREQRKKYQVKGKRDPRKKLKRRYMRTYPHRYKRRGVGFGTPAERSREWRQEQKQERERGERQMTAGMEALAEAMEMLGFEVEGSGWPANWSTQLKDTKPPGQLEQNKSPSQPPGSVPRSDPSKQKGESLRAPDLPNKPQRGLQWEVKPSAPGGLSYPVVTTMNPTDGSGKVLPLSYYTDMENNTQQVPDSRQERYLHNNNFDVKVAYTLPEVLKRVDSKIKERAKEYEPRLARSDTKNWIWHWRVGDHTVKVQAFKRGVAKKFPKLNLRISCTCPYWRWWGPAHWATREDYQRGKAPGTATYPKVRDPAHWRPICKHAYAVLERSLDFFVRPEKSPLKKLGARFSFDKATAVEVEFVCDDSAVRVARAAIERELGHRVLRRYLDEEES